MRKPKSYCVSECPTCHHAFKAKAPEPAERKARECAQDQTKFKFKVGDEVWKTSRWSRGSSVLVKITKQKMQRKAFGGHVPWYFVEWDDYQRWYAEKRLEAKTRHAED